MALTLLATEVPAVQAYSGLLTLASLAISTDPALPTARPINNGDSTTAPADLNRNFGEMNLGARYGGGAYAIAHGLALSAGSGLTLNISAGHAVIDGVVELAATTQTMYAATTNHVWLKRDGTIDVKNNVLTAPTTPATYLGAVVTGASTITSVDTSGRVVLVQGQATRQTADLGMPLDTPSSSVQFLAVTSGGKWWWNGTAYLHQTDALPQVQAVTRATQDVVIPEDFQNLTNKALRIGGSLRVYGRARVTA